MIRLTFRSRALLAIAIVFVSFTSARADESKFLRFVPDKNGGATLQASVVRYENKDGVTVDLVAAVHIAEPSFYAALNNSFDDYDAVLFELVAPRSMLKPISPGSNLRMLRDMSKRTADEVKEERDSDEGGRSLAWVGMLQRFMRDRLKLTFQLDAIDYKKPNFIHADLDAESFFKLQKDRHESFLTMILQSMIHEMSDPDAMAEDQPGLGDLIAAFNSPDSDRRLKLLLGKMFGRIDQQMAGMDGPNGSVILTERNKTAMETLQKAIAAGKKNMAIFYGAAHLKGMEKIMTTEMGFHQVGPPFWRVAWDMSSHRAATTRPATTRPATRPAMSR